MKLQGTQDYFDVLNRIMSEESAYSLYRVFDKYQGSKDNIPECRKDIEQITGLKIESHTTTKTGLQVFFTEDNVSFRMSLNKGLIRFKQL